MSSSCRHPVLDAASKRLVDGLDHRKVEASREAADAIFAEILSYAESRDEQLYADVRHHVELNIEAMLRSMRAGRPPTAEDLEFVRPPTTRRAQRKIPLDEFLHAFRLGLRHIWRSLLKGADTDESRIAALGLVEPVSEYINIASTRVAEIYAEVEQLLAIEGEQARRDVLDDLLAGVILRPTRSDALAAAGLSMNVSFVVVSALLMEAGADMVGRRAAAIALGRMAAGARAPLSVQRGDEIVAILPAEPGTGRATAAALSEARAHLARQRMPLQIGASTILSGLAQVPAGYREACLMRSMATKGDMVLGMCGMSTFSYLTLTGDDSAMRLVSPEIAEFVTEDFAADGTLTSTLIAYADADLCVKVMSERLFIHTNTGHKRLNRIAERTGRDLRSVHDIVELLIAIRLLRPLVI